MRIPVRRSAACLFALAALAQTGCGMWRRPVDIQRDYARTQMPAPLAPRAPAAGPARPLAVRVLVDDDYRAEILRWQGRIEAQVERANRVLEAQFGIRLVVKELRPWAHGGKSRSIQSAIEELEAADPGQDVEWVVGFVSSTGLITGAPETVGLARMSGRHLVLRGMVSSAEEERFRATLDALPEDERDALLRERELHRETAILLHEWAHTLGAIHEKDPASLLSPHYAPAEGAFSPLSAKLIALGLAWRASTSPGADATWATAYRAEIERARAQAWDAATVDEALALAAAVGSGAARAARPTSAPGPASAPANEPTQRRDGDAAILVQADLADRTGDPRRAWTLVEPIATRHSDRGKLQAYACHLRRRAGQRFAPGDACRTSKRLEPAAAALLFPQVLVEEGDRTGALEALLRVEASLAGARPPSPAKDWAALAEQLGRLDACTPAERVAARAPAESASQLVVLHCATTRRRTALPPPGAPVELLREPDYVEAVLRGRAAAQAGRLAPAHSAATAIDASFPGAPGGALVRCLAEAQSGNAAAARAACAAADAAAPLAPEPPHVLGLIAGDEGRWSEARAHLARALERDETDRDAWAHLATALGKVGDTAALDALDRRHRARFRYPLRPAW